MRILYFSILLFVSGSAFAVPDSLLYPKAQLEAFKGRVAAAKRYADTATVLFSSVAQVPAIGLEKIGKNTLQIQNAIAAGKSFSQMAFFLKSGLPADTFLLTKRFPRDTFTIKSKEAFNAVHPGKWKELKTYEYATTGYKFTAVPQSPAQWMYEVEPKTKKKPAVLHGSYLITAFEKSALPLKYSRAVHYFQQLAGTSWPAWATFNRAAVSLPYNSIIKAFYAYTATVAPHPFYRSNDLYVFGNLTPAQRDSVSRVYKKWLVSRLVPIDSAYKTDPTFKTLLINATAAALRRQEPVLELVELLDHFGDPQTALTINNFRFAYSPMCLNSYRFRLSFLETAKLAAHAGNWPNFIWTHLSLSNVDKESQDKILYDWDSRFAYTRELEYLGIDMSQLLLGMALETAPKTKKSIGRISALWRESNQPETIAEAFATAATDSFLDLYNRMICYWILAKQFRYGSASSQKKQNTKTLARVAATLPHWVTKENAAN